MSKRTKQPKTREGEIKKVLQSEEIRKLFDAIEKEQEQERSAFRGVVDALRNSSPLSRAEGCLRFWADRLTEWGDLEAVVYFASRGHDCTALKRTILTMWRDAEDRAISRVGEDPAFTRQVREDPTKFINAFWNAYDSQELSIDATMLRIVEWCNVLGFDPWWQRQERIFERARLAVAFIPLQFSTIVERTTPFAKWEIA